MPVTTDLESRTDRGRGGGCDDAGLLPVDPWRSLRVRFGMLLGVDDFETLDAYHRGKGWLHAAWLHREGTVWGLGVRLDPESNEVRVEPGLALDALGRELHLETRVCLDAGLWLDEHVEDPELEIEDLGDGSVRFDAHVVASFRGCLTRQVPALVEPCDGSGQITAYSRVYETIELRLVPGPAPARDPLPYHRLRLLFGLEDPIEEEGAVIAGDQEVLDARDAVAALPAADRPRGLLDAFRRFAALDAVAMEPAEDAEGEEVSLFPALDPAPLVLAELRGLTLSGPAGARSLEGGEADDTVRAAHVATATLQELLCGPAWGDGAADSRPESPGSEPGPVILPESVRLTPKQAIFETDRPVARASLSDASVEAAGWDDAEGWSERPIDRFELSPEGTRVTVVFVDDLEGDPVRLLVRGTGPRPLVGADLAPLGAAAGNHHDGRDFAFMIERS